MDAVGTTAAVVAERVVAEGVAPLAAAGWCARSGPSWVREVGGARDVLFDLASVTKPMTAVAIARAGVDRRTPLGALVPELRHAATAGVAIELLLAHRAGLDGHRPLFAPLLTGASVDRAAALADAANALRQDVGGDAPPHGYPPLYSDLGYVLAGEALARATHARDAGEAILRWVLEPLGVERQAGTVRDLAAHDVVGPYAPTEAVAWRTGGGVITGAVHDENAWALTGLGGSGHAGIFATIDAVLTFGAAVLDALQRSSGPLAGVDIGWLVRERPGGTLRAGFDGKSTEGSSAGTQMSARSFGHLGFTGTSLWIDPDHHVVTALLTNRVSPTRTNNAIRAARPWAHDALFERARRGA